MTTLQLTTQGARVRVQGYRLRVDLPEGAEPVFVRLHEIERVLLFGAIELTASAMARLLDARVDVALFTRDGRLRGRLSHPLGKQSHRRRLQVLAAEDASWRLVGARALVAAKIREQAHLLEQLDEEGAPDTLRELAERASTCDGPERLRGLEGAASRLCYARLRRHVPAWAGFQRRAIRPPPDPANAVISFGSMYLQTRLAARLEAAGLDPFLGLFHDVAYGRPALACDLVEPMRPRLERRAIAFLARGDIGPAGFVSETAHGVRMTRETLQAWSADLAGLLEEEAARAPAGYATSMGGQAAALVDGVSADIEAGVAPGAPGSRLLAALTAMSSATRVEVQP